MAYHQIVEDLKRVADSLENYESRYFDKVLFPGWDMEYPEERRDQIRRAARAIAADGISPDEGTYVSRRELGMLLRYIADMMG